jgi:hypothetical protein
VSAKPPRFTKRLELVTVRWFDAGSSPTLVFEPQRDHRPVVMETIGWVLVHDAAGISVATERFSEEGVTHYRGWSFVPAGMIDRVQKVRS